VGAQKSGPEVVRYGLWRIYALRLAAAGPTWLGQVHRDLQDRGFGIGFGPSARALASGDRELALPLPPLLFLDSNNYPSGLLGQLLVRRHGHLIKCWQSLGPDDHKPF
jgi:hypothetical protein